MKLGALRLMPSAETRMNSDRLRSRTALVKVGINVNLELLGCYGNGKTLSTFCAAALDYQTTIFGGHANEKTVGTFT